LAIASLAIVMVSACGGLAPQQVTTTSDGDAANEVASAAIWARLAARDDSNVFAATESVKVIVDRHSNRPYFLQSRRWPLHFDFATRFLSTPGDLVSDGWNFNLVQYHDPDRRFVLGTLLHFPNNDSWTFELYAGDTLSVADTIAALDTIRSRLFFASKLRYRPMTEAHRSARSEFEKHIAVASAAELFGEVQYQAIEHGTVVGRVRIIDAALADTIGHNKQMAALTSIDIAVLDEPPLEIPPVAAIISAQMLAPLGHIAVLAHSRHTPTAAVRDHKTLAQLRNHKDQWVQLTIAANGATVTPLNDTEAARALASAKSARLASLQPLKLAVDNPGMLPLAKIHSDDLEHFGAKTVQLAKVASLGAPTPRAFGLPFAAYLDFLHSANLDQRIATMLSAPAFRSDPVQRRRQLTELRAAMLAAPVPSRISVPLAAQAAVVLAGSRKIRLRSSTNAEDLGGFSGAGLYQSVRVEPLGFGRGYDDIERGLREVWASVWSFEAFEERAQFGIDQARVAMAILVQESIDTDDVTGVIITGNPFYRGRPAIFVNAAPRGSSVTGAGGGEVPEQLLHYTFEAMGGTERISRSTHALDRDLLSDSEVEQLSSIVEKLHEGFIGEKVGTGAALDIEFLITHERKIVILQARPYTMQWGTPSH
jgi:rifampicin phosphotransferase